MAGCYPSCITSLRASVCKLKDSSEPDPLLTSVGTASQKSAECLYQMNSSPTASKFLPSFMYHPTCPLDFAYVIKREWLTTVFAASSKTVSTSSVTVPSRWPYWYSEKRNPWCTKTVIPFYSTFTLLSLEFLSALTQRLTSNGLSFSLLSGTRTVKHLVPKDSMFTEVLE